MLKYKNLVRNYCLQDVSLNYLYGYPMQCSLAEAVVLSQHAMGFKCCLLELSSDDN